jgi:hypothetical protein
LSTPAAVSATNPLIGAKTSHLTRTEFGAGQSDPILFNASEFPVARDRRDWRDSRHLGGDEQSHKEQKVIRLYNQGAIFSKPFPWAVFRSPVRLALDL